MAAERSDENWNRIADDVATTTGRDLCLRLHVASHGLCEVEVDLDGAQVGRGYHRFLAAGGEEFLVELADYLQESILDEEIWGGWPICPDHGAHPLSATTDQNGAAVWLCPHGQVIARIGELANRP